MKAGEAGIERLAATARPVRPTAFLAALLLAYSSLVGYASLAPFGPWEPVSRVSLHFLLAPLPRHITLQDVLVNVLAYLPVGTLAAAMIARRLPGWRAVVLAMGVGFLLSFTMEWLQAMLPPRIPSNIDLLSNSMGALLGALPWLFNRVRMRLIAPVERLRARLLVPGIGAETGALLLCLWCACHLNPSIPFLGAGVLQNPDVLPWDESTRVPVDWALQALAAALSACGIGLFMTCLLQRRSHALVATLVTLVTLLGAKATAAQFLLKPALVSDWFSSAALAGLAAGALVLPFCLLLRRRMQTVLAGSFLLSGGLLAKLASHYAPLASVRALFGGNFVQLRNFAGLTVWINEIWPLLAVVFLALWWPHAPERGNQVSSPP